MNFQSFNEDDTSGKLGIVLDKDITYRIGRAFAEVSDAKIVALGRDV